VSAFEDIELNEKDLSGAELFVMNEIIRVDAIHAVRHKAEYTNASTPAAVQAAMNGCAVCRAFLLDELRRIKFHDSNLVTMIEQAARTLSAQQLVDFGETVIDFEDWWTHVLTEATRDRYRTKALQIVRLFRLAWPLEEDGT
jgi:hypothetical protein